MQRNKKPMYYLLIIAMMITLQCANLPLSGGASDQGNAVVVGKMVDKAGNGVRNAQVQLLPVLYDPVIGGQKVICVTTDENGIYVLPDIDSGVYNIQAVNIGDGTRALIRDIHVDSGKVTVSEKELQQPGEIKIMIPSNVDRIDGYVFIPGTSIAESILGMNDFIIIDSVPSSASLSVCYETRANPVPKVIRYDILVNSGKTEQVLNTDWCRSMRIYLNTTVSGAGIAENVTCFPLLVRLSKANIDLKYVKPEGMDLRFVKSNGTMLPYQIAMWDTDSGTAEVWVKIDTVYGNSDTQYVSMLWGNPSVVSESKGSAVFDSTSAFEGVWHLDESSGKYANDASHNNFSGIYNGSLPTAESSPIGTCQRIVNPDKDYIDFGDVLNLGTKNISIGAWIKRTRFGTQQALVAKSNGDEPSVAYGYLFTIDLFNQLRFYMASGGVNWGDDGNFDIVSNVPITDSTEWHFVFASIDRSDINRCKLYIDGIDRSGATRGNVTGVANVFNTCNFRIATESDNNYSYPGSICKVSIAFVARSAAWVKLAYINQSLFSKFLIFEK